MHQIQRDTRDKVNRGEIRAKSGQDRAGMMVCGPIATNDLFREELYES
jgi:hypothetical protein